MPIRRISGQLVSLILATLPVVAIAHHSLLGYDTNELIEVEGDVTDIFWMNPHIRITLSTASETGQEEIWTVEGLSVNTMERLGVSPETVHVGDFIAIVGHPSTRLENTVDPVRVTLASGDALILDPESASAFGLTGSDPASSATANNEAVEAAIRDANGIFRVWTNRGSHWSQDSREWGIKVHPLREEARLAQESWVQARDDVALSCTPAGMPEAIMMPFPIEFMEQDGDMLLRIEEWDNVRTIHMGGAADPESQPPSHLGYSVGRWDGNTLIVETSRINYPFFDDRGTPMSEAVEIVERFTLSEDETNLDWTAIVTDPLTFTEPVAMPEMHWEWIPGQELKDYNCTVADD